MRIFRLAEFFVVKNSAISSERMEESIRSDIDTLWKLPNYQFNILKSCAESQPQKPKNINEIKAIEGFKFCQELVGMIDYLGANKNTIPLGELKEVLLNIAHLIKNNQKPEEEKSNVQFPYVSELIFEIIPVKTKQDRVIRDQQFAKAKTGLSRILSFTISMMEKLSKLEMTDPDKFININITNVPVNIPARFSPQRASLSIHDIIDFIRQHGDEYGISTTEDWGTVFLNDSELKEKMTTIINAINRGHIPRDSAEVKMEIAEILMEYEKRKSNNVKYFEHN